MKELSDLPLIFGALIAVSLISYLAGYELGRCHGARDKKKKP